MDLCKNTVSHHNIRTKLLVPLRLIALLIVNKLFTLDLVLQSPFCSHRNFLTLSVNPLYLDLNTLRISSSFNSLLRIIPKTLLL